MFQLVARYASLWPLVWGAVPLFAADPAAPGSPPERADPVAALKPLLAKIGQQGTTPRVTDFSEPGKWRKEKRLAADIKYDVSKTDSLTSPFAATVTWLNDAYFSAKFPTRAQAERAEVPEHPVSGGTFRWWARLAFQDGKWVVQDVGWDGAGFHKSHRTVEDPKDPVHDWWIAFGGDAKEISARLAAAQAREAAEAVAAEAKAAARIAAADAIAAAEKRRREEEADRHRREATRTWTEAASGREITAQFLSYVPGKVKLQREDGTVVVIPTDRLSAEDQDWIRDRMRRNPRKTDAR